MYKDLKINNV